MMDLKKSGQQSGYMIANSPYAVWQKQQGLILSGNATFKDNKAKVIYQSGNWELRSV